jgi:tetratricopeptide (TPR) repeat protein
VYEHALSDPDTRGTYLNTIGRFQEAADSFAGVDGTCEQRALAVFKRGKALRAASRCYEAAELLEDAAHRLPTYAEPRIELALARASLGSYYAARDELHYARELEPDNSTIRFLISRSARQHLERARFYSAQGDHALAARDCEAALLMEPTDWDAILTHGRNLALLGRTEAAHDALARYVLTDHASAVVDVRGLLELADTQLALGDLGAAKVALERAARLQPHEPRIHERRARIDRAAANKYPVLSASQIVQLTQAIPGWFWPEESELLIGLALRAAANAGRIQPPQFVEIGSYCGRSTIALGLVLKMLRKTLGRVIAVDDPTLGPAPDGRTARSVLREHLAAHELEKVVLLAPEEDAQPELRDFQLVLVDGQHDEAHVEADIKTYSSRLTRGGLLAFHDYADYFPDVQRSVDRLLLNSEFAFVAHVRSLIALERRDAL